MKESTYTMPFKQDLVPEDEAFLLRLWLRVALLLLMYVTARFLATPTGASPPFDIVVAAALAYNILLGIMEHRVGIAPMFVLTVDLMVVVLLCCLSGGIDSVIIYFGIAYFYLMSPYVGKGQLKATLLAYTSVVSLMVLLPAGELDIRTNADKARVALVNIFIINGTGWPAVLLSEYIARLRRLQKTTMVTFHSLYGALQLRTENLQTALDALTQSNERLKETDEMKTRFLSNVSHELRTPLASIRSYTEILQNYDDIGREKEQEFLGIIHEESRRLNLLINDLLSMIKLEGCNPGMHTTTVDMSEIIRSSVKLMDPMAAEKGLYLNFKEKGEGPFPVKGNKYQLKQVMVNLLNNALKFTSDGGVEVWLEKCGEELQVGVKDTGEGIFPEEKDDIFHEFYRVADDIEGRPSGSGLGLQISKKIVELHGGKIWVDSTLGEGSTFVFSVPVDLAEVMSSAPAYLPKPLTVNPAARKEPLVLVVESKRTIRQLLRKLLESRGYHTLGAADGRTALKAALDYEPDLIVSCIMSYKHPDRDLHKGLRNSPRTSRIPVILTSIIIGNDNRLQVSVNGFVSKPVDRFKLAGVVKKFSPYSKGTVLLVSTDKNEARSMQVVLGNDGYKVVIADHVTASETCRAQKPSLVLIDASLPDDGYRETIRSLRHNENTSGIPVALVTELLLHDGNITWAVLDREKLERDKEVMEPVFEALYILTGTGSGRQYSH